MKHVFLDFDRTLFDTEQFYNSPELTYLEDIIAGNISADFSRFLYSDVPSFIWNIREAGFCCRLVTFGRRNIQECKFNLSGLGPYFDQQFYVEQGSKAEIIKNYLRTGVSCEKLVFIDDTIAHLEDFRRLLPDGLPIRMTRPGAKDSEVVDSRFMSALGLDWAYRYIIA